MEELIIGELQVWPRDLGKMTWDEATSSVKKLGEGWRPPTIEELRYTLYPSRSGILLLVDYYYWSSTKYDSSFPWTFNFTNGNAYFTNNKYTTYYVRAVRDFTWEAALEYLLKDF